MSEGRSLLASSQPNDTALRRSCGAVVAVVALVGTAVTLLSTGLSPTDTHLFAAQGQATPATRHIQTAPRVANPLGLMPRPKAAAEAPTGSISESRRPQAIAPALGTPHVTGFAQRVLVLGSALLAVPLMIMGMRLQRRTRQSLWADLAIDDLGAVDRRFAMAAVVAEAEDCGCDDGGGQRHDQRDGGDEHAAPVAGADGRGRAAHVSGGGGGRRGQGRGRVPAAPRVTFLLGPSAEWLKVQPSLREASIKGPMFISVGTVENLNNFLELNPDVPRELAFVEDSANYDAYKAVGFKNIFEVRPVPIAAPKMGWDKWWPYLNNIKRLVPGGDPLTESVRRLGGTFALNGADVVYSWSDSVPGDHPAPQTVLKESGLLEA
eukprot:CAMPEP_0174299466 /NCGR_PEP_ID=MMETSP0809-20121228/56760_1 /TAXON_ID=73025 ORGANISM="Eutreptiella gymnastica-like, Strain CCMP1594" /NCGR_SAMPLE_ID=MMETSP0809 /ASSEMBLY_ACC=CAM_ASM_000658 /LENGTH=377 /DNA_ID=CAMNT_0015404659 /DNA_START=33 /DNA_END=1166 /DNA_ORIENTATION=-